MKGDSSAMTSKYDTYSEGSQPDNDTELRFSTHAMIDTQVTRVFGSESQYGQSLGVALNNPELEDGAVYVSESGSYIKLVSWQEAHGLMPTEALERGDELTADDADEIITQNYGGDTYRFELVAARVAEVTDENGDVVLEASSRARDWSYDPTANPELSFGEFEDYEGDTVLLEDETISWFDGSNDYGPSAASKRFAELLTEYGNDVVTSDDDVFDWLLDVSGDNIIRNDLVGRPVRIFLVQRESENGFTYQYPVVEDLQTGEAIGPNNRASNDDSDEAEEAREADSGTYPEPVADFISSAGGIELNDERAENLLDDMIEDADTNLTTEMIEDSGGRAAIISQVV